MKPVLLTGDSHLGPIKRSMVMDPSLETLPIGYWPLGKVAGARHAFFDVGPDSVTTSHRGRHNRTYSRESISGFAEDAILAISLPMNTSRILRDFSWNSHAPWHLAKDELALSDAVMSALVDQDSRNAVEFVIALKRIWPRTVVIEAPRFFKNASYLACQRFEICSYVDRFYRERILSSLTAASVDVIAQPAETIAADGTTDLAYDHETPEDDHHGNMQYGLLTLRAVLAYASSF